MQFSAYQTVFIAALPFLSGVAATLNPSCHPGGNFDLSKWDLETPIDDGKGRPLVIKAANLSASKDGCSNGWQDKGPDHQWFFTVCAHESLLPHFSLLSPPQSGPLSGSPQSALDRNPPMALW